MSMKRTYLFWLVNNHFLTLCRYIYVYIYIYIIDYRLFTECINYLLFNILYYITRVYILYLNIIFLSSTISKNAESQINLHSRASNYSFM